MSTCAQACEHDTQSAHDAACSHATVPVDVSSTAHCWFGTSSGTCCTAQCPAPLQSVSPILATKNDFPEGPVANQNCRARVGSGEDSKCCASATCPCALSPSTGVRKRLRGGPYLGTIYWRSIFGHNLNLQIYSENNTVLL